MNHSQSSHLFQSAVKAFEFSDDSKCLYTCGVADKISFWNCETGELLKSVEDSRCQVAICLKYENRSSLSCVAFEY